MKPRTISVVRLGLLLALTAASSATSQERGPVRPSLTPLFGNNGSPTVESKATNPHLQFELYL